MHPELVRNLGRLKFRQSYAQNVLLHSIEVGYLAGLIAAAVTAAAQFTYTSSDLAYIVTQGGAVVHPNLKG